MVGGHVGEHELDGLVLAIGWPKVLALLGVGHAAS
jgi:hypothetical protein